MSYFETPIKVWGFHLDVNSHVNNARYLEFLEQARWEYFDQQGEFVTYFGKGYAFAIVNININFRSEAVLGDDLVVLTKVKEVSERKSVISQVIQQQDSKRTVVDAEVTFVVVDTSTGKAVTFDDDFREFLEKLTL